MQRIWTRRTDLEERVARPAAVRRGWRRIVRARNAYLLILPTFVMLGVFQYYPALMALYASVFNIDYGTAGKFVGLGQFVTLFEDPIFIQSIWHILALTGFAAICVLTVPVAVAEWIFWLRSGKARYVYRIIMLWPAIVPMLVTILIWQFIYTPQFGVLGSLLSAVGLGRLANTAWLGDPNIALYALMGTTFPFVSSLAVLIYLAGLERIPRDLMDAAIVDGAPGRRRFWRIDLPLIKGQLKLNLVLTVIVGLQNFIGPLVLTQGGPINSTMVPGLYMYQQAFSYGRLGYASAIGVAIFVAIMGLTIANLTVLKQEPN
jgi:raffinose/stachyose/melibiose transport system permease protein